MSCVIYKKKMYLLIPCSIKTFEIIKTNNSSNQYQKKILYSKYPLYTLFSQLLSILIQMVYVVCKNVDII